MSSVKQLQCFLFKDTHRFIPYENHFLEHTFYVLVKNKMKSFRNEKTFLGLFSKNKQQEIKGFIDAEKINMENPDDLLKVLDVYSSAF